MTYKANRVVMGELPSYRLGLETYDPDKLGLGHLMTQESGGNPEDNYAGPFPLQVARPMEYSTAFSGQFPWAMRWSESATDQQDWVFAADGSTAAATRKIGMWVFDRLTHSLEWVGNALITFPGTSEAKTVRGLRMSYRKYTTGTVSCNGPAVVGVGVAWATSQIPCVGNRIGFGSTDPSQVTEWSTITFVSESSLGLQSVAKEYPEGTPYVIEDLRAYLIVTSATASLGGLYVVKGLNKDTFTLSGAPVPAATTVDNIRACYFLRDAATGTVTAAFGGALQEAVSDLERHMWVATTPGLPVIYKFNIYAPLTVVSGASNSAIIMKSGTCSNFTGTISQNNNGRVANTQHGPGAGEDCFYFTSSSRILRTIPLGDITTGLTTWITDAMPEAPPGSSSSFVVSGALSTLEYISSIDRFLILSSGTGGHRSYLSRYLTDGSTLDRIILVDYKNSNQAAADSGIPVTPSQMTLPMTGWVEGGVLYLIRNGTTALLNQMYVIPLGADWEYTGESGARLVLPRIHTPDADEYVSAYTQEVQVVGSSSGMNLGMNTEPMRLQFRTSGIGDNSGGWTMLDSTGDLSGVAGAEYIQFRAEFRVANTMIPARILNVGVVYKGLDTDDHFLMSDMSDPATKRFVWWFAQAFGSTPPNLRVRIFDALSNALLVEDDAQTPSGTWEVSTNGGSSWAAYAGADRTNATTYLRFTPASIADDVLVKPVLSVL